MTEFGSSGWIAVDWGTTNRRAYRVGGDGAVQAKFEDNLGVTGVASGGFPEAVAQIAAQLGDLPMLLAGMIGSNRGWREAPYVPCPADAPALAAHLLWVEPGQLAIVPGLSLLANGRADVMRGEEVQVFGCLAAGDCGVDALICHPGTHSKWIALRDGAVADFTTVMTGELFALLRAHSILAPLLEGEAAPGQAFVAGVAAARGGDPLTAALFGVRARVLLEQMDPADAGSYVSGLLIGTDITAMTRLMRGDEVIVLGRPSLTRLYAAALRACGQEAREVDGADAFVAGMRAIREMIQ